MVLTRSRFAVAAFLLCAVAAPGRAQRGALDGPPAGPRGMLFGFALECVRCESTPAGRRGGGGGRGAFALWHYSEYPRVAAVVSGGPAARAGIQVGDLLRAIDGLSLLTDEGSERLRTVAPRDDIRLELERNGKLVDINLSVGRVGLRGAGPDRAREGIPGGRGRAGTEETRPPGFPADYSAHIGAVALEIWSSTPVIASTDSTGATLITIGGTTIRLRDDRPPFGRAGRRGAPFP
jgi:hypothetical protein